MAYRMMGFQQSRIQGERFKNLHEFIDEWLEFNDEIIEIISVNYQDNFEGVANVLICYRTKDSPTTEEVE